MGARVLIVEDMRLVAMDLQDALAHGGYEVVGTETRGDRVVAAVQRLKPDLVLMDVRLEGPMDGIEAARALRDVVDVPVVFLTANSDDQTVRRIHEAGAAGYLVKPFGDDQLPGVLEAALAHHRDAEAIRARGNQLWVTLQSIGDAVLTVDPDGRIDHLNPAAEALCAWSVADARGRRWSEVFDLRVGKRQEPCADLVRGAMERMEPRSLPHDAHIHVRTGEVKRLAGTAAPVVDEDGQLLGAVLAVQDQSERERMQELLARADRLASMGTLAASIAHEVNNPLTYVIGNVQVVLDGIDDPDFDRAMVKTALRDVEVGARTIERIVRDLKLLSTPDHKTREAVDVRSVVQRSLRMVARKVRARGRLEAALSATLPVLADPVALGQVVWNLVQNAAQALPAHYDDESVVRVETTDDGISVRIVVEDNGCGIPEEILDRIFDPFFTTKPVGEGSGLGLAVSHQIVKDLGGRLAVSSKVGVGTRIEVHLPVNTDMPSDDPTDAAARSEASYPSRRVLVVDDDRLVRRALGQMLSRVHTVETLGSVEAALEQIRRGIGFDAILCDLMMSPLNGVEFLVLLQEIAPDLVPRTAFITGGVMTAGVQEQVIRSGRPLAYKPFEMADLLSLIETLALS